ncbi:MAG: heme-binding domain-containing protein [Melioribacteraceae bacterium]|nr:heme-binding domain-containing protein [Melioribacteraceae bacterium]
MKLNEIFTLKRILISLIVLFLIAQLFQTDKTNPESDPADDFITIYKPPTKIAHIIKTSCYDCHSYHTRYPWYSYIAPVSWIVKGHIDEGRKRVNFSTWNDYDTQRQKRKLGGCTEAVSEGEMPLPQYLWLHHDANLTGETKEKLVGWFKSTSDSIK